MKKSDFRIIYMGTPEFAVPPLHAILKEGYPVVAVITAPDKPAGRGKKIKQSPIKEFAIEHNIPVLQPEKLKNPEFIEELKELKANLQVVVAFRMLPEIIWAMPALGTFNLHASLLPDYRGAAPINWAIINGEKKTGVTTFFIQHEIDTGHILLQEEVLIDPTDNAGTLHDKLMNLGASVVVKTLNALAEESLKPRRQDDLIHDQKTLAPAPKIFKDDCRINWNQPAKTVYNFIRGLSPHPAAFTDFVDEKDSMVTVKIFNSEWLEKTILAPGEIHSDGKEFLHIGCMQGYLKITELQQAGKKRLSIRDFLRGISNKPGLVSTK